MLGFLWQRLIFQEAWVRDPYRVLTWFKLFPRGGNNVTLPAGVDVQVQLHYTATWYHRRLNRVSNAFLHWPSVNLHSDFTLYMVLQLMVLVTVNPQARFHKAFILKCTAAQWARGRTAPGSFSNINIVATCYLNKCLLGHFNRCPSLYVSITKPPWMLHWIIPRVQTRVNCPIWILHT